MKRLALAIGLAVVCALSGCAPTPFTIGPEVLPPAGCTEARGRGHEC